jgi:MFS family permease
VIANTRPGGVAGAFEPDLVRESVVARWMLDLTRGFQFLYAVRVLFALALVAMLLNFFLAPLFVVLPVLVKQGRGLPPWYLGALESSMGAGAIVGATLAGWLCRTLMTDRVIVLGIGLIGISVGSLPWMPGLALPIVAMLCFGAAASLANIPIMSQLAVATPDTYRSRVNSIMLFLCMGVAPLGVAARGCVHRGVRVRENDDGHGSRDTPARAHAFFDSAPLGFLSADAPGGSRIPPSALPASLRRPRGDGGARIASANRRPPNVQSQLRGRPCDRG